VPACRGPSTQAKHYQGAGATAGLSSSVIMPVLHLVYKLKTEFVRQASFVTGDRFPVSTASHDVYQRQAYGTPRRTVSQDIYLTQGKIYPFCTVLGVPRGRLPIQ